MARSPADAARFSRNPRTVNVWIHWRPPAKICKKQFATGMFFVILESLWSPRLPREEYGDGCTRYTDSRRNGKQALVGSTGPAEGTHPVPGCAQIRRQPHDGFPLASRIEWKRDGRASQTARARPSQPPQRRTVAVGGRDLPLRPANRRFPGGPLDHGALCRRHTGALRSSIRPGPRGPHHPPPGIARARAQPSPAGGRSLRLPPHSGSDSEPRGSASGFLARVRCRARGRAGSAFPFGKRNSGTRDLSGLAKGRDSVPRHNGGAYPGYSRAHDVVRPGVACRPDGENRPERKEKKANNLVPQGVNGLHDSRHDMPQKRSPLLPRRLLPHLFIVTKPRAAPAHCHVRLINCR